MKGCCCNKILAIKTAMTEHLCSIPETAFQSCFKDLQKHWQQCTSAGGAYFEDDQQK
jgi:5,10-methenyltetrahydromethanopterin hydrogenase